jgi:hypothetical protein
MKRSTERYIIRGVILVLCVLLALPFLWLLIIFFGPEVTCMIHNLGQDDPAVRAASKITEREPGVLDFRALAGDYDHICLVDDQYDLEDQSLPGNAPRAHRVGRELCGNYKKYGPVFGLVSGGTFIFLRHWFGSLPPAPVRSRMDRTVCQPLRRSFIALSALGQTQICMTAYSSPIK